MLSRTALPAQLPPAPVTGTAAAARRLADRLTRLIRPLRVLDAVRWPEAAAELAGRFAAYFGPTSRVAVTVCGGLASDAAAGNGYLKLRAGATFSPADVRLLEVHEGWAHLATTLNGLRQPVLPVLARC